VLLLDTTLRGKGHCTEDAISSRRMFVSELGEALRVATCLLAFFGILEWLSITVLEPELMLWKVASNSKLHA